MECSFDVLVDDDRFVYCYFGLPRSVSRTWPMSMIVYYAEQKAQGRKLHGQYEGAESDPLQMGGNFILDREGKLALIHRSKISPDRPTVDDILRITQRLKTK